MRPAKVGRIFYLVVWKIFRIFAKQTQTPIAMEEIKKQIKELFKLSEILSDYQNPNWIANHDQAIKDMTAKMDQLKALAKANNTLIGRVIALPHADGQALYVVTKVLQSRVTLKWLPWIDNWQDDVLEGGATVSLKWAVERIRWRDNMDEIFSKKPLAD